MGRGPGGAPCPCWQGSLLGTGWSWLSWLHPEQEGLGREPGLEMLWELQQLQQPPPRVAPGGAQSLQCGNQSISSREFSPFNSNSIFQRGTRAWGQPGVSLLARQSLSPLGCLSPKVSHKTLPQFPMCRFLQLLFPPRNPSAWRF